LINVKLKTENGVKVKGGKIVGSRQKFIKFYIFNFTFNFTE